MKIRITESQFKLISEIKKIGGDYQIQPIFGIIQYYSQALSKKQKIDSFRDFFTEKIGVDLPSKINRGEILNFYNYPNFNDLPDIMNERDSISGFAYYLAKKYFDLKEGVDLVYFVAKDPTSSDREFFFFDPLLKIFVGKINLKKQDTLKGKSFRVKMSAADEQLIGTGYGLKMYQTLIEKLDYLSSDYSLFSGAYRMWKHILPKYYNVWGVEEKELGDEFYKIDPTRKKSVQKYDYFVASKHEKI